MRLLAFGYGYTADALRRRLQPLGWDMAGVARSEATQAAMRAVDVEPLTPGAAAARLGDFDAVLVAAPPGETGCPAFQALAEPLRQGEARPAWIGYLSTTGVYGDLQGGWAFEDSPLRPLPLQAERRVGAERAWLGLADEALLDVMVFRLPGIYGPEGEAPFAKGRSPLAKLRAGTARIIDKPGQVFSRIHVDDLAAGLHASLRRPRRGGIYNLCDDKPCATGETLDYAAGLLGQPSLSRVPFDTAELSPEARRFYAENKRVSNARAKAELRWRPVYPTYREGFLAL
jgi:nucleoside-diphosphate-sugar epimerase